MSRVIDQAGLHSDNSTRRLSLELPIARSKYTSWKLDLFFGLALLLCALLFSKYVIQNFSDPMTGTGDSHEWSYQAFFFKENLRLWPWPQLNLHSDHSFYPYGVNQIFRAWSFERNYVTAYLLKWFGEGPWVQVHYLASIFVLAIGSYLFLFREHGRWPAAYVAMVATFGNFYAIAKFPGHANIAGVHWTTLNIIADYVLAYRYFHGANGQWTARLLLARAVLLVLAIGQDLGYVAGYALSSFVITMGFIFLCEWTKGEGIFPWRRSQVDEFRHKLWMSVRAKPFQVITLILLGIAATYLYVPLAFQIASEASSFDMAQYYGGIWYSSPLRLAVPLFPSSPAVEGRPIFGDLPEALFENSPGLFLLVAAVLGMVWYRDNRMALIPALLLMLLCLVHHPEKFPIMRIFPWFQYARVSGRATVIYPVILALASMHFWRVAQRHRVRRTALAICFGLMLLETKSAYEVLVRPKFYFEPNQVFHEFMAEVAESPGEAVFEWPFCIAGGNGVGTHELGRYFHRQAGVIGWRQFHGKKVVGDYFGRLHPDQITPLINAGWPRMFFPDDESPFTAQRQSRDFTAEEWKFFEDFFALNDFCGLIVYYDLLPPETVAGIESRYGAPVAETNVPYAGRLLFFRKPAELRGKLDRELGKHISLAPT